MTKVKLKELTKYFTRGYRGSFKKDGKDVSLSNLDYDFYFNKRIHNDNNWYCMNISSLLNNKILTVYKIDGYYRELSKFKIENNDIILPLIGRNYRPIYIDNMFPYINDDFKSNINLIITNNLSILEVDEKIVNPKYIVSVLDSKEIQEYIKNNLKGKRTKVLSEETLMDIEIPIIEDEKMDEEGKAYIKKEKEIGEPLNTFAEAINENVNLKDIINVSLILFKKNEELRDMTNENAVQEIKKFLKDNISIGGGSNESI